ncbi:adenosylcobinamide-GDP ribazoletransferase [Actinomadura sp. HBU206391]|uniref:adenosylcobinamide-GDP ribazoletransferase n=1 Tax=Actinomadura sp. HBU206391 TaxID=2731692 RepID=UPI00164F4757|nr:adenosylcobinamide-GDP ribazoletransferase [Actinomadura sp. HBU206391]MBC6461650.1 adenosylcobinamide-GDP ribazoletransferase [Actinomadura sp. HBU206391]
MTWTPARSTWLHGLRFATGTLSVIPVRVSRVDRQVARAGMLWAPAVGALIGVLQAAVLVAARELTGEVLLAAALTTAAGGLLTRGLHLDGLADVADGLGSGKPAAAALEIMRRSDIGPFGVVTLVLTLLVQVTALAAASEHGIGGPAIVVAAATGRLTLTWACRRGVPAARPDGLGAAVAGSVPAAAAAAVTGAVLAGAVALAVVERSPVLPAAVLAGLVTARLLRRHLLRRLGGVTGDVLGALAETAVTAALLVTALA